MATGVGRPRAGPQQWHATRQYFSRARAGLLPELVHGAAPVVITAQRAAVVSNVTTGPGTAWAAQPARRVVRAQRLPGQ